MAITAAELKAIVTADTKQAQDALNDFNSSLDLLGKGNALSSLSTAFENIGQTMMGISLIGDGMFAGSIVAAADYEKNLAILGAIENSTMQRNKDMQVVQAGWVNVTNASSAAIQNLTKQRDSEEASLAKLVRQYENGSNHTKAAAERINELKIDIADLNNKINEGSATHKVWTNGIQTGTAVTHMSREAIDQFANALERSTRFSKEQTLSAIMMGETFTNISSDLMPKATLAAMNLSTVFGRDLRTSVIMVDKALQEPIRGVDNLRRIGVQFSDAQKEMIQNFMNQNKLAEAQAIIMHELDIELGGAAEAAGDTMVGKMDQMGNAFKRVFQEIGSNMLPGLENLIGGIVNFVYQLEPAIKAILQFIMGASLFGTVLGAAFIALSLFLSPLGLIITTVGAVGIAFNNTFGGLGDFFNGVLTSIQIFANNVGDALKPVFDALKFAPQRGSHEEILHTKTMNEETGRMEMTTSKIQVQDTDSEMMGKYLDNLKNALQGAVQKIGTYVSDFIQNVKNDFETKLKPKLDEAFKNLFGVDMETFFTPVKDAWEKIIAPFFKGLASDLSGIIENLKKVDWGVVIPILAPIAIAILGFSTILKAAGLGFLIDGLKGISEALRKFSEAINLAKAGNVPGAMKELGDALNTAAPAVGAIALGLVLMNGALAGGLVTKLGALVAAAMIDGVKSLGLALLGMASGLWATIGPIVIVGLAIGLLIAGLIWVIQHKDEVIATISGWTKAIGEWLGGALVWVKNKLIEFVKSLAELFRNIPGMGGIAAALDAVVKTVGGFNMKQDEIQTGFYVNGHPATEYKNGTWQPPATNPFGFGVGSNMPPPVLGQSPSPQPPQINIAQVNVNNVRNPEAIYDQVKEEARRRNANVRERVSYA